MAEGLAHHLGKDKIKAYSAGSHPSSRVHPDAISIMREKGISIDRHSSKGLKALPPLQWDAIVTMGCKDACPHLPAKRRYDWNLPNPNGKSPPEMRRIRDEIESRVQSLLQELEKSNH